MENKLHLGLLASVIIGMTLSFCAHAKDYGNMVITKDQIEVHDGDTLYLSIKEYPPIIGDHIGIRVLGVDTPEIRGKCDYEKNLAQQAKTFTTNAINNAKKIELKKLDRDKYFRILAELWIDDKNFADMLITNKLAYAYFGEAKTPWCK